MPHNENALKVADALERAYHSGQGLPVEGLDEKGLGFNMGSWWSPVKGNNPYTRDHVDNCNTVGCVVGWCHALQAGQPPEKTVYWTSPVVKAAGEWLGFKNPEQADNLFLAKGWKARSCAMDIADIHPLHVVAVLRHYGETGEVDWTKGHEHTTNRSGT